MSVNARSFDLLAFRGGDFVSDVISNLENTTTGSGEYTHVGMIVKSDVLPSFNHKKGTFVLDPSKIYVLESTFSFKAPGQDGTPDVVSGKGKLGVQLRDLDVLRNRYLKSEKTKIDMYHTHNNPLDTDVPLNVIQKKFKKIFEDVYSRKYEMDVLGLAGAMSKHCRFARHAQDVVYNTLFDFLGTKNDHDNPSGWLFCSELVGKVYVEMGIIKECVNPQDMLPVDFLGFDRDGLSNVVDLKSKIHIIKCIDGQ